MIYNILSSFAGKDWKTVNPSLSTGKDYPVHSLMINRMAVLHQNSEVLAIEISLDPRDARASGMDFPMPPSF